MNPVQYSNPTVKKGECYGRILQSLASFEDCQEPEHWQIHTPLEDCEAVARAAWLRLYVMGFFSNWKKHKLKTTTRVKLAENPSFADAYLRFWQFARDLNLLPDDVPEVPDFTLECLRVLFNYDVIIRRLADVAGDNLKRHRQALEAIVRIELWLQGYDCVPGNPGARKRRRGPGVPRMRGVLKDFWADNPDLRHDAPRTTISAGLFAAFRELLDTQDNPEQEADYVIGWLVALLALGRIRLVLAQVEGALNILGNTRSPGHTVVRCWGWMWSEQARSLIPPSGTG